MPPPMIDTAPASAAIADAPDAPAMRRRSGCRRAETAPPPSPARECERRSRSLVDRPWYTRFNWLLAGSCIALTIVGIVFISSATLHEPMQPANGRAKRCLRWSASS